MTQDPVELPFYHLATAARWVGVPTSTLDKWVYGREYLVGGKTKRSRPLISVADADRGLLSFANIAEAHILAATRGHRILMSDIRAAIDDVQADNPSAAHPLLTGKFFRRGRTLFVERATEKISASSPTQGQRFLRDFDAYLERIEINQGQFIRLFPVRRNENKVVVLNSDVAGGRPIIAGTGILVEYVQDLRKTGLSTRKIAEQYGLDEMTVVQALNYISSPAA
jgi:uncharacterized protein (DUF433 family)